MSDQGYEFDHFGFPACEAVSRPARFPLRQTQVRVVANFRTTDPVTRTRRCSICHEWKPLTEFHRNRADRVMGRMHQCKVCNGKRQSARAA